MQKENSTPRPLADILCDLRQTFLSNHINQSSAAKACSLNQSQISRLLDGKCKRLSKGLERLCIYASVDIYKNTRYDPANDASLMGALRIAVGNSASRARQIERVMRALVED